MERRFSLYRRGKYFYAQLWNPATKTYSSGRSTGMRNKNAAALVVAEWLRDGLPEPRGGRRPLAEYLEAESVVDSIRHGELTREDTKRVLRALKDRGLIETATVRGGPGAEGLVSFLTRFWDYESSPYVRDKLAHGHRIGRRHCYDYGRWVGLYWKPAFGEEKRLGELSRENLKAFSLDLAGKGLAPKTVNNILSVGTVPLRWAHANELIPSDPGKGLMKFSGTPARRGVLSEEEVRQLFAVPWPDPRARIGNVLAMSTGLRAGEVLAVQVRDIGEDRLAVRHSWSNQDGLKSTKTGVERSVPLVASVRSELLELARKSPHGIGPGSFVFWSVSRADRPMDFHFLLDGLKAALLRLSLTQAELEDPGKVARAREYWRSRAVVFHSWRHWYAARMADRLEARKVMVSTGHKDPTMFAHYADHGSEAVFREVLEVTTETFGQLIAFPGKGSPA